jgi:NAD(P)-dependent dehydrogenase (short-subunit alcohol dehydrogenase family)
MTMAKKIKIKTLIIGCHTAGIGDAYNQVQRPGVGVYSKRMPTISMLNVEDWVSIREYLAAEGPFDEIVYSAGISQLEWVKDVGTAQRYDRTQNINTRGVVLVASAHVELFPEHPVRYAVIVSDAAHTAMRGSVAYCVSKAGAEMAVMVLARELAPLWTVVGISPGVVDGTGMTNQLAKDIPEFRGWTPEAARAYEDKSSVLGRRVTKEEVAETILFALTGPQALNGSILTINGGK